MPFAIFGNRILRTGVDAASDLRELVNALRRFQVDDGMSFSASLDRFLAEAGSGTALADLAEALKSRFADGDSRAGALLVTLRDLETRSDAVARQVGWPAREWSLPKDALDIAPFTIKLNGEGGAFFEILADGEQPPAQIEQAEPFQAVARVALNGKLAASADAGVDLATAGVSGDAGGGLKRALSAYVGFASHETIAGLALASALAKLRSPTDFDGLIEAFGDTDLGKLLGLVIEGDSHLGAGVDVRAALPTQYGDVGLVLGGEARLSRGFRYSITTSSTGHGLALSAGSSLQFSTGFELGVSYSVGLSTILPGSASKLVQTTQEFAEPLQAIDEATERLLDRAETWLKPGTLIKTRIRQYVSELLSESEKDGAGDGEAQSLRNALANLVGIDTAEATTEDAIEQVGSATTDLIAGLVDDSLGILQKDTEVLSERLRKALHGRVTDKVIERVKDNVIERIIPDLDAELERLAKELDDATRRRINEILGRPGEAGIEQLREYLEQSRSFVSKILDGISRAQTELLAAEVGWRRERARERGFDFRAEFDAASANAKDAFRRAVLKPRRFGDILVAGQQPQGVSVEEAAANTQLFKSHGPRWNLALVGLALGGSVSHRSDVSVIETPDGVTIATRGEIRRTQTFLKETRSMSFLSALGLIEAKHRGEADATDTPQDDGTVKVHGPRAAARIKLDFTEDDDRLHLSEAEKLLSRFVEAGLVNREVEATFLTELRSAIEQSGEKAVEGSISIALAIPSSEVVAVLESARRRPRARSFAAGAEPDFIGAATRRALAVYDPESVDEVESDIRALGRRGFTISGLPSPPGGGTQRRSLQDEPETSDLSHRMEVLDMLSRIDVEPAAIARSFRSLTGDAPEIESEDAAAIRRIKHLVEATEALRKVLEIGAVLYFDTEFPNFSNDEDPTDTRLKFTRMVEQKQRDMSSAAKPFLKTGIPAPSFLFGNAPRRTVALFAALQEIARSVTGVAPPLILTVKAGQRESVSIVSAASAAAAEGE
jgi:hypothetical protein